MRKLALMGMLAALIVSPASALISDGNFEGAGPGPWTTGTAGWGSNQTFDFDAAGPTGQALRLYFPGGSGSGSFAAIQTFTVPAGVSSIQIDLDWLTQQGVANGWYEILLQSAGGNYDAPGAGDFLLKEEYGFGNPFPPPHGTWRHESFTRPVTPGGNYQIALKMGGSPGTFNEAWFDNVVITPEPAALLMLAIPSALLLRRRRAA